MTPRRKGRRRATGILMKVAIWIFLVIFVFSVAGIAIITVAPPRP